MWIQVATVLLPKVAGTIYDKVFTNDKVKVKDMEQTKKWYQSKGVWGSVVAVVAGLAGVFGYDMDIAMREQLTELLIGVGGVVGGIIAFIGRIKADKIVK